jgi:hypothetical protein
VISTVHLRDLGGYVSRVPKQRYTAAVRAVRQTMQQRGRVIVNEEINATQPRPPVDRRTYANSWFAIAIPGGGRLYSKDLKASIIERGRRPGFGVGRGGIEALMGWAHRHGMDVPASAASNRVARRQMLQRMLGQRLLNRKVDKREQGEASLRAVAFAIAANIKKRGLWQPKGLRVFERAKKRIVDLCRAAVHLAIAGAEFNGSHDAG